MKYDGYDVYDIIYRNDSAVKKLLERDPIYLKTGFIILQDVEGRIWYLYKKGGMLIPERQEYLERTYGRRDMLPKISRMKIGKDECECSYPAEEFARDFFIGLSRIEACTGWRVEKRLWKILSDASMLYDAPARMVRPEQYMDRVTLLRCAYVSDRKTKRRNFSSFADWKYLSANDMAPANSALSEPAAAGSGSSGAGVPGGSGASNGSGVPEAGSVPSGVGMPGTGSIPSGAGMYNGSGVSAAGSVSSGVGGVSNGSGVPEAGSVPSGVGMPGTGSVPSGAGVSGAGGASEAGSVPFGVGGVSGGNGVSEAGSVPSGVGMLGTGSIPSGAGVSSVSDVPEAGSAPSGANMSGAGPAPSDTGAPEAGPVPSGTASVSPALSGEAATASVCASAQEPSPTPAEEAVQPPQPPAGAPVQKRDKKAKKVIADIRGLLECDKRRCRLEAYEENMLYDIKRGHWDLYDCAEPAEGSARGKLVARDPRKDIRTGVVGIDFGTKSTVVVRQDDTSAIMPIRIGAEVLSACLRESDYENPTIIECINLDEFMKKYEEREGRPETSCEDFFVSYDAGNDYRTCLPSEFYAFYADLKQWANHEKENVVVLDKQKQEYRFGADGSAHERIINPIELYAYYIGMYINNMRNGIYMKYLMSFPVGYSKETRQLIVRSFEKGIRKSLPACVLEDAECMKEFSVCLGISEPAAYAVTALEMSDLDPEDEEDKYRYGIFDFGGGTADFGFGVWRGASEEEYEVEGYDYVLECFGADSDVTLGGEKILELLAYAVFKKNRELARRKRITCSLPFGEQAFPGSEALISNSQIAQRNMSILKEELRPLWHQEENWERRYRHQPGEGVQGGEAEEYIEISMYDIDGNKQPDCRFIIDTEELTALIKARIQKGIDAFFKCMTKAFRREDAGQDGTMYIFLAGNSSKSVFVKELFEKTIQDYSYKLEGACFKLMEPLNPEDNQEYEYVPNAKTSVAYGLIKSREGSSIKVEKNFETDAQEQTRFKYYLGRERKRHFDCRLSPAETEYGQWIRFQGAAKQTLRIYYTTNPTADVREEPPMIDNIPYREVTVEPRREEFLFIRACEPTVIEYAVAPSEEKIGETGEICRMDFGM